MEIIDKIIEKQQNMSVKDLAEHEETLIRKMVTEQIDENTALELSMVWMIDFVKNTKKYKVISSVVYETKLNDLEDEEVYVSNIDRLISTAQALSLLENEDKAEKYKESLYNHFGLAIEQKKFIIDNIGNLKEDIKIAEANVEKIKDTKGKIYTEFVTILGIFTTIIFAVFGGFQGLGLIGVSINETPVSKLIMFLSLMMMGIGFLIFLSYNAVSKLTNLELSSCGCEKKKECTCHVSKRHPTLFYSSIFFVYLFIIGSAFHIYQYQNLTFTNSLSTWIAVLIVVFLVVLSFILKSRIKS